MVKNLPADAETQETQVQSLVRKIPWNSNDNHTSTLAWKIPWTEEPSGLQSMGLQRVGHDSARTYTHTHTQIYEQGSECTLRIFLMTFCKRRSYFRE